MAPESKEQYSPLVSIIVITYNSEKYVLETLESAKAQTYKNIELIISDDGSKDSTIAVCREWLALNAHYFVRTEIITTDVNTGIPANCNRGVNASNGEWVKLIAGDDLLMNDCIALGVKFIHEKKETKIFASNAFYFNNDSKVRTNVSDLKNAIFFQESFSPQQQFNRILNQNDILAPTLFIKKELWKSLSGFDEQIPFMEDYPFYLKVLKSNVKIDFLDAVTVGYRQHSSSISGFNNQTIFNSFYKKWYKYQREHTFSNMTNSQKGNQTYIYLTKRVFDLCKINNRKFKYLFVSVMKINLFRFFINNVK